MDSGYCPKCGQQTGDMHDQELCVDCEKELGVEVNGHHRQSKNGPLGQTET